MGLRVSTNIASVNAQRNLSDSQMKIQDSFAKLSSGSRINKSADDAAGLAISENLKGQLRSTRQANRNANDGISMVQTAEGGLQEISNIVIRLRELGIQAASDNIGDKERGFIDTEVQQLKNEANRIAQATEFNGIKLLDGSSPTFDFQIGVHNNEFQDRISFEAGQNVATLDALGLADVEFATKEGAQTALEHIDESQYVINKQRANLGALQNRLQSTATNLGVFEENIAAANSRIRDTDVANATAEATRNSVMLQAGTATLAQANQSTQLALKLIG